MNRAPKTAPKNGPAVTVRFRTKAELALVKRAARVFSVSLNTYMVETVTRVAGEELPIAEQEYKKLLAEQRNPVM